MSHCLEYVYGYHGCHKSVAEAILSGSNVMLSSANDYDWLGTGIYFWEEAPARAYEWAMQQHPDAPTVIGAKIRLGRCLNLMDISAFRSLRDTYDVLKNAGVTLPKNGKHYHRLDCLVINTATSFAEKKLARPFDTVRPVPCAGRHPLPPLNTENQFAFCKAIVKRTIGNLIPRTPLILRR